MEGELVPGSGGRSGVDRELREGVSSGDYWSFVLGLLV